MLIQSTEIDDALEVAAKAFATKLGSLSSNPVLREGVMKAGISSLVIALQLEFPDCRHELRDALITQTAVLCDAAAAGVH